ncbi:CaiB/BaiF CoA transferase family protein [Chloroflexota bacterium]
MTDKQDNGNLLPPVRVLDLSDEKGFLCGKILGDMGADVIKVERPGGDPGRNIGPFYHDIPDPEKSLFWFAFNGNKRGITLNIEADDGQQIFRQLVKDADILIESFNPGYMDGLGLGYPALNEINPRLIMVSVTPFGQTGPYKDYQASDIVCMAMAGFMSICGDGDRPPVRVPVPQAYLSGAADGAAGAMMAYYYRESGHEGQHVDISIQESMLSTLIPAIPFWQLDHFHMKRYGSTRLVDQGSSRIVWPCRDGYVNCFLIGGVTGARTNKPLSEWMEEEGMLPDFMREIDWDKFDIGKVTSSQIGLMEEHIDRFFRRHTKAELYQWAIEKRAMLYPVFNSQDLVEYEQLSQRGFWVEVDHPELGVTVTYPGAWAISSEANLSMRRRAPLIGEHNREIYESELGITGANLAILKQSGVI